MHTRMVQGHLKGKIILINLGKRSFIVEKGARIAQMVLCPIEKAKIKEVEKFSLESPLPELNELFTEVYL